MGSMEKTTIELKDCVSALTRDTADVDGTATGMHNSFAGGYTAAEDGQVSLIGVMSAKTLCVAGGVGDTIGGSLCAIESPEVCNLLNFVAALETDGEAITGKAK